MKKLFSETHTIREYIRARTREKGYGRGMEVERTTFTVRVVAQAWWDKATQTLRLDLTTQERRQYSDFDESEDALPPPRRIFDVLPGGRTVALRRVIREIDAYLGIVSTAYQPADDADLDDATVIERAVACNDQPLPAVNDVPW